MSSLPARFADLILAFAPLFVHRSWCHARILFLGAMLLRTAAARTVEALQAAIQQAFAAFTQQECRNYINAASYQNDCYVSD